jgi:hypothetical protein
VGMKMVRDVWVRELTAMKNNKPLRQWRYDPNLPMIQADE